VERRAFIGVLTGGFLAAPLAAEAQSERKVPKIGIINFADPPVRGPSAGLFWEPMRKLGWVEGQNVVVERRNAAGDSNQIPRLAEELVQLHVDVFLVTGARAAQQIQRVTQTIPICAYSGDFQAAGVVTNLAKPDRNVTGVQDVDVDLAGKRLALLKEAAPSLTRAGMLLPNRRDPTMAALVRAAEEVARPLGLQLMVVESPRPEDFVEAFAALTKARVRGLMVAETPFTYQHHSQILALAAKNRLAAIYEKRYWVEAGGLISYGVVQAEIGRRMAECVDKILRGAKPSEVPVQQLNTFQLVINLKTAKALGLTIPPSLLARADEVIE